MTFSIVAYDADSQSWGVAVASKFLAVGALVPWGRAGVGAIATQASVNLAYGPTGLAMLDGGSGAQDVVAYLTGNDPGHAERQVGVVDALGGAATFTGENCMDWAGGTTGDGFAAQGNILAGPGVVDAMAGAFRDARGTLARRLLAALLAGDAAGGDARGRQGAALRVWREGGAYGGVLDIAVDLRVDDHPDPSAELGRLLGLHELYFTRPDPATLLPLTGELAREATAALRTLGHDPDARGLPAALYEWAAIENLEERLADGHIDPEVLQYLRKRVIDGS